MRKHGIKRQYRRDLPYTFYAVTQGVQGVPVLAQIGVVLDESTQEARVTFLGTGFYLTPQRVRDLQVISKRKVNERLGQLVDAGLLSHARVTDIPVAWMGNLSISDHPELRRNVLRGLRPIHVLIAQTAARSLGHRARRLGQTIEDQIAESFRIVASIYEWTESEARQVMGDQSEG